MLIYVVNGSKSSSVCQQKAKRRCADCGCGAPLTRNSKQHGSHQRAQYDLATSSPNSDHWRALRAPRSSQHGTDAFALADIAPTVSAKKNCRICPLQLAPASTSSMPSRPTDRSMANVGRAPNLHPAPVQALTHQLRVSMQPVDRACALPSMYISSRQGDSRSISWSCTAAFSRRSQIHA